MLIIPNYYQRWSALIILKDVDFSLNWTHDWLIKFDIEKI